MKKPRKKIGRPRAVAKIPPVAKLVVKLAGFGCTNREIASITGLTEQTLGTRFRTEMEKSRGQMRQRLRMKQIQLALGGHAVMLIWLGKQMLGQSDVPNPTLDPSETAALVRDALREMLKADGI